MPPHRLLLVRHGQTAGFMTASYNQLTDAGIAQGRALGTWWASRGQPPERIFRGPQPRQRQTAEAAAAAYREHTGRDLPEARLHEGFDEHQGPAVALVGLPQLAQAGDALAQKLATGQGLSGRERARLFRTLMQAWLRGDVAPEGVETFAAFRQRVGAAVDDALQAAADGRRVAVFTSAGTIAAAAGHALGADDQTVMELSWSVLNGSLTELRHTPPHRPALMRFNTTPHLAPDLETFL